MLTDDELIDQLRDELATLLPPSDLIDQLRHQAAAPQQRERRRLVGRRLTRLKRPVSSLVLVISSLLAVGIAVGALALLHHRHTSLTGQQSGLQAGGTLVLTGDGLGGVTFGASPARVLRLLDPLLGAPGVDQAEAECGVDRELTWPILLNPRTGRLERSEQLMLTFDHGRFVGYQYGGFDPPRPGHPQRLSLRATTTRGLAIGDSLAIGQRLYGQAFQISAAQGGSWQLRTAQGTLRGYAYETRSSTSVLSPSNLVASIAGGDVGCPAASP